MPRYGFPAANKSLKRFESGRAYRLHKEKVSLGQMKAYKSAYEKHRQMLNQAQAKIDHSPPRRHPHLMTRLKQMKREEDRMAEVDYENQILLQKMKDIMQRPARLDNWNEYERRSLNRGVRKKNYQRLVRDNVDIARRLESTRPMYDTREWENEYQFHLYLREQLADPEIQAMKKKGRKDDRSQAGDDYSDDDFETDNEGSRRSSLPSINGEKKKGKTNGKAGSETGRSSDHKLPQIKKSNLSLAHSYEMYWGDLYDPDKAERDRKVKEAEEKGWRMESDDSDTEGKSKKGGGDTQRSEKGDKQKQGGHDADRDAEELFKVAKQMAKPEPILIRTLVRKTHKQRMETKAKFREKYDLELDEQLKDGLGRDWDVMVDALLEDQGGSSALAIQQALERNDIPAAVEILASKDKAGMSELKNAFRKAYSGSLEAEISEKTNGPVELLLLSLAKESRDDSPDVDEKAAEKDGVELHESGTGRWTSESGKFIMMVESKSNGYIKAALTSFKQASGQEATAVMKGECDDDFVEAASLLMKCAKNPGGHYAEKLYKNMDAANPEFVQTLVTRSEIDMPSIKKSYKKKYSADLTADIDERVKHPTTRLLKELANKSPPAKNKDKEKKDKEEKQDKQRQQQGGKKQQQQRPANKGDGNNPYSQTSKRPLGDSNKQRKEEAAKKSKQSKTVKEAENFDPDDDVARLRNAMKGVGTDEQVIIDILTQRNNEQRQQLRKKYKEKYDRDLDADLKSELSGDFEEVILALMMTPACYDAHCLKKSMAGAGTDESMLIAVLATRTPEELAAVKEEYKKAFGKELEEDIKSDTSGDFQAMMLELAKGQRSQGTEVNRKQAQEDAKSLFKDGKEKLKADDPVLRELFTEKSKAQMRATADEYKKLSKKDLRDVIAEDLKGDSETAYLGLLKASEEADDFYVESLQDAAEGLGTKDSQLIRVIVTRSEIDLGSIKEKYKEKYGHSVRAMVDSETSGDYKKVLLALLGPEDTNEKRTTEKQAPEDSTPQESPAAGEKEAEAPKKESVGTQYEEKTEAPSEGEKADEGETQRREKDSATDELQEEANKRDEDCARLRDATKGLNADEQVITEILSKRTNKQRQEIQHRFKEVFVRDLEADLKWKLGGDYEELVVALLQTPARYQAHCLHSAMTGLGTDEDMLVLVLATCPAQDIEALKEEYKNAYKKDLEQDVDKDTSGAFKKILLELLKGSRDEGSEVNQIQAKQDAIDLYKEGKRELQADDETLINLVVRKNTAQVQATKNEYKTLSGKNLDDVIAADLKGDNENVYLALSKSQEDVVGFYAEQLHACFSGTGTKDSQLICIIVSRHERDLAAIQKEFESRNGKTVAAMVKSECSGDYKDMLLALLGEEANDGMAKKDANKRKGKGQVANAKSKEKDKGKSGTKKTTDKEKDKTKQQNDKNAQAATSTAAQKSNGKAGQNNKATDKDNGKGGQKKDDDMKQNKAKDKQQKETAEGKNGSKTEKTNSQKDSKEEKTKSNDSKEGGPKEEAEKQDDCQRLRDAMQGLGTDEKTVVDVLTSRTSQQRQQLKQEYQDRFGKDLEAELQSELSGELQELVVALLQTPARYLAHCLHSAMAGLGTDEDMLVMVLATCSAQELEAVKEQYKSAYKKDLEQAVEGETSGALRKLLLEVLKESRDQGSEVDQELAQGDAKALFKDGKERLQAEDETLINVMVRRNAVQLKATKEEYKKLSGNDLDDVIAADLKGDSDNAYQTLSKSQEDVVGFHAEQLHACFSGTGTKDSQLICIVVSRHEKDLDAIQKEYESRYGKSVAAMVRSECSGDYQRALLLLLGERDTDTKNGGKNKKGNGQSQNGKPKNTEKEVKEKKDVKSKEKPNKDRTANEDNKGNQHEKKEKEKTVAAGNAENEAQKNQKDKANSKDGNKDKTKEKKNDDKSKEGKEKNKSNTEDKKKDSKEEKTKSNDSKEGGPKEEAEKQDDCQRLRDAMQGLGTDEKTVVDVLTSRTSQQRQQLKQEYKDRFGKDLEAELQSELSGELQELVVALLQTPARYQAHCLHSAMTGLGTDEDMLVLVLATCPAQELQEMKEGYTTAYGKDLEESVEKETNGAFRNILLELLKGSRDQGSEVDLAQAQDDAKALYKEGKGPLEAGDGVLMDLMIRKNNAQLQATKAEYKKLSGKDLDDVIAADLKGDCEATYLALSKSLEDEVAFYAEQLHASFSGVGIKDSQLISIVLSRHEKDLDAIQKEYESRYGKSVAAMVRSECSGDYQRALLLLLGEGNETEKKEKQKEKKASKQPLQKTKRKESVEKGKKGQKKGQDKQSKGKDQQKESESTAGDETKSTNTTESKDDVKNESKKEETPTPELKETEATQANEGETAGDSGDSTKETDENDASDDEERKKKEEAERQKDEEDCQKLHEAMWGVGTDEKVIVDLLTSRTSQQRQRLQQSYKEKYNKDLETELQSELVGDLEQLVVALLQTPARYQVHCLHSAMAGLGTDEDMLVMVLATCPAQEMQSLKGEYKNAYKKELEKDVEKKTKGAFRMVLLQLLKGARDSGTEVNDKQAQEDAKALYKNGKQKLKEDDKILMNLLVNRNAAQSKATKEEYKKLSGKQLEEVISKDLKGDVKSLYLALSKSLEGEVAFYAEQLHAAFSGLGTKYSVLIRIVVSRHEVDLHAIKAEYEVRHKKSLCDTVKSECTGDFQRALLNLLENP